MTWIAGIASELLDAVSGLFLDALGTDMTAMEEYFPFVVKAYDIIQVTAWAILALIVVWQLFRAFGGPITEAENPWHLVTRGAIYAFLIGYAKPIFSACLNIARAPYTSLMDVSMTGEDFTFAGVEQVLTNGLATIVSSVTVVGPILILILLIALGWNYFKLLLETVERYIVIGVLCYTAPLAFSMGGSKATNNVMKSWCRMVGSQLLLLVMNVWFLRGFASSVGQFIANGGALTTGKGSIFLWAFCALAYLKCAQRFDSYLASLGLNAAQTGSSMGMELIMAARVLSGTGSGARSAGAVFGGGSAATGTGAAASGFASGFASRFHPNSYVRDAVVDGGSRMGFGGGTGFVGRAFGGIAARNGAVLNGDSISSVASRAPNVSGSIAGDIADRSLSNYMPQLQGFQLQGTQITGGHISTTATSPDGKQAAVDLYSASQFEKPEVPHSTVTASDGSQWYQIASGEGRGAFYDAPVFHGADAPVPEAPSGVDESGGSLSGDAPLPGSNYQDTSFLQEDVPAAVTDYPSPQDGDSFAPSFAPDDSGMPLTSDPGEPMPLGAMPAELPNNQDTFGAAENSEGMQLPPLGSDTSLNDQIPGAFVSGSDSVDIPDAGAESFSPAGQPAPSATEMPPFDSSVADAPGVASYSGDFEAIGHGAGNSFQDEVQGKGQDGQPAYFEAPLIAATFPTAQEGVSLRTVDDGVIEATSPDGGNTLWYNSAYYQEPDAPHSIMRAANGVEWYAMQQQGDAPQFESGEGASSYNEAAFRSFLPGYESPVSQVDGSHRQDGHFEVRNTDGSGTAFYDTARYAAPRGDYQVYEDARGSQWYAIRGEAAVERKPVFENGAPVYDGENVRTVNVETIRYRQTPARYKSPEKRGDIERKPPRRKR